MTIFWSSRLSLLIRLQSFGRLEMSSFFFWDLFSGMDVFSLEMVELLRVDSFWTKEVLTSIVDEYFWSSSSDISVSSFRVW